MIVSREAKYIFIHIPRTGGTSISKCLSGTSTRSAHGMNFFKEYNQAGYFVFCFVRNPFDRIVSAFLHAQNMSAGNSAIRRFLQANAGISFSDFVVEFLSAELVEGESHFRPQTFWLREANPDFVGRFERLATDFDAIAGRLALKAPLERRNDTNRRADFRDYYSGPAIDKVARLYAEDIDLLKYRFDVDEPAGPPGWDAGRVQTPTETTLPASSNVTGDGDGTVGTESSSIRKMVVLQSSSILLERASATDLPDGTMSNIEIVSEALSNNYPELNGNRSFDKPGPAVVPPGSISEYIMSACWLAAVVSDFEGFARNKVSSGEWSTLQALKASGPVTTSVLAKRMLVSRRRLGKAVKKLESKGFIQSMALPNDKGSTQVSLTEMGASTLAALAMELEMAAQTFVADKLFGSLPKATKVNKRLIAHVTSATGKAAKAEEGTVDG
jgi:DNA-binding MarR family transcriptional regulator